VTVFLAAMTIAWLASGGAQNWDKADLATTRLPPSAFPELPAPIQRELERRGCTIPQPHGATHANVIKGRFTSATQTDWAILCSIRRTSSILVFRNGSPSVVAKLATQPDRGHLRVIADGVIGYSRMLAVADADFIRVHYQRYGGTRPPPLDHNGIDDAVLESASLVWYWYRGRWLQLTGSN
jgi:hypothetical protein